MKRSFIGSTTSQISALISNAVVLVSVLMVDWSLVQLMLLYVIQTFIFMLYHVKRMWSLTVYSSEGVRVNGKAVEPTQGTKKSLTAFFVLHFGIFNVAYAAVVISKGWGGQVLAVSDVLIILISVLLMAVGYHQQTARWIAYDKNKRVNIGTLMFVPYIRIVPMHVMALFFMPFITVQSSSSTVEQVVAGAGSMMAALVFLGLKAISDAVVDRMQNPKDWEQVMKNAPTLLVASEGQVQPYDKQDEAWSDVEEQKILAFWEKQFETQMQRNELRRQLILKAQQLNIKVQWLFEREQYQQALKEAFIQALSPMAQGLYRLAGKRLEELTRNSLGEQAWREYENMHHQQRVRWSKRVLEVLDEASDSGTGRVGRTDRS